MLERGIVSRILFPAPPPSYDVDCFPQDLIWVPKDEKTAAERSDDPTVCPPIEDCVPCLLLTYPSARFLIIFFHSNAEDLGRCHGFCCYIRDQFQVHVLAVEYPGYGICPGVPCGESVMENALAAMRFVINTLQWPMDSIKVFGRSIGTGPAIGLASAFSLAGLILVTPFLSVQELFRDRVGPFASLVEEWFPNSDSAPKITSPTMIIHGQRDELIACRHGESIYELLRPRKLLISPPEMEHNTNLLTNLQFFVLPMFQFFALPDYAFQDLEVPPWAYDKRRSPFYTRPGVEISSHQLPNTSSKKRMAMPAGDDGTMPVTGCHTPMRQQTDVSLAARLKIATEKAVNGQALSATNPPKAERKLEPMFSPLKKEAKGRHDDVVTKVEAPSWQATPPIGPMLVSAQPKAPQVPDDSKVADEEPMPSIQTKSFFKSGELNGATIPRSSPRRSRPRSPPRESPRSHTAPKADTSQALQGPSGRSKDNISPAIFSPEAREMLQRLEDAGQLFASDICSDELCVLEERPDTDNETLKHQEQVLADLVRARACKNGGCGPNVELPVPPRLLAASRSTADVGPQPLWPSWCSKPLLDNEVPVPPNQRAPAPGLPRSDSGDMIMPSAPKAASPNPSPPAPLPRSTGLVQAAELLMTSDTAKSASVRKNATNGIGNASGADGLLWAACCSALPSDELARNSPLPRPRPGLNEDEPVVPFSGRVLGNSDHPMSRAEEDLWRKYPLGTDAPPRSRPPAAKKEKVPELDKSTSGFKRGTKFAI
jgi:hypothetical protein